MRRSTAFREHFSRVGFDLFSLAPIARHRMSPLTAIFSSCDGVFQPTGQSTSARHPCSFPMIRSCAVWKAVCPEARRVVEESCMAQCPTPQGMGWKNSHVIHLSHAQPHRSELFCHSSHSSFCTSQGCVAERWCCLVYNPCLELLSSPPDQASRMLARCRF